MLDEHSSEILKEYARTRDMNQQLQLKRKHEIYERIPRIAEIDREIRRAGLSISRAILNEPGNHEHALKELKTLLTALKQEKAFLLTDHNIPFHYLDLHYDCKQCQDTGFLANGKKCSCFKQQLINRAYAMSNLSHILDKENFQHFNINLFSETPYNNQKVSPKENMMSILTLCEDFVFHFDQNNEENLLFYGPTGLGKTFLANCIAKSLLDKGKIVVYQTAFKIFEILEEIRFHNNSDKRKYHFLFDADLLIIDDLGTEISNTFTNSELFNIINSRLLAHKKTIISTNLNPKDFGARYDDRIGSRLFSKYTPLKFFGDDLRWQA